MKFGISLNLLALLTILVPSLTVNGYLNPILLESI